MGSNLAFAQEIFHEGGFPYTPTYNEIFVSWDLFPSGNTPLTTDGPSSDLSGIGNTGDNTSGDTGGEDTEDNTSGDTGDGDSWDTGDGDSWDTGNTGDLGNSGGYNGDPCATNYDPCLCDGDCGGGTTTSGTTPPCPTPTCDPATQKVDASGCACEDLPKKNWYNDKDEDGYHDTGFVAYSINKPNLPGNWSTTTDGPDCDDEDECIHEPTILSGQTIMTQNRPGQQFNNVTNEYEEARDMHVGDLTDEEISSLGFAFQLDILDLQMGLINEETLFIRMENLFKSMSIGEDEDTVLALIDRFRQNDRSSHNSPNNLSSLIAGSPEFSAFEINIENNISNLIREKLCNNVDITLSEGDIGNISFGGINNNLNTGLSIAWHGTWAYDVQISDIDVKCDKSFSAFVTFNFYDNFGLDDNDVDSSLRQNLVNGFRAWYILQRRKNGIHFEPYVNEIILTKKISGQI